MTSPVQAVILDLDGTLVDSAGEIAAALACAFDDMQLPRLAAREVETFIGRGVRVLVERALQRIAAPSIDIDTAVARFQSHYARLVGTTAMLFEGVAPGLRALHAAALPLAVVTNKPRAFTERLLDRLGVRAMFTAIVAGDDGVRNKPAGDMLLAACRAMKSEPAATLMVGDSDNDVAAARAAGCPVWCVPYGYNEGRGPEALACDRMVATIEEAAQLLARFPSTRE